MAMMSPSQSTSYRHGVQGCPGGCCGCQRGEHRSIRAEGSFVPTYRVPPWETASQMVSQSSNSTRVGIAMPETGFNTRCMGHHGNSNGFFNLPASSNPLPQNRLPFVDDDQKPKGNDGFTWMPLHVTRNNFTSILDTQIQSTSDETFHPGLYGFVGLDDIGAWNQAFWTRADDALLPIHAVNQPMPVNIGDNNAGYMQLFDQGMPQIPLWANEPITPIDKDMQYQLLHTAADMNGPLYDIYPSLQAGEPWDESLQQDMEHIPLPPPPRNEPFEYTLHNSNGPAATELDFNVSYRPSKPEKSVEFRSLVPKPAILSADAASGVDIEESAEAASPRRGRRRCLTKEEAMATALIRKIGCCARCTTRKTRCTGGKICEPCQQLYPQYMLEQAPPCPRGPLTQYQDAIFPSIIFAHLSQPNMKTFLRKAEFTNVETRIQLSLGSFYPTLPLVVSTFRTTDEKFSQVPDLISTLNDDKQSFATIATSHLGVQPSRTDQLEQICADYLEMMNRAQKSKICSSRITNRVLDAARRFQQTSAFESQDILLRKWIQIAEIYLLMGKRFLITVESSPDIAQSSTPPPRKLSRLLDRQIKSTFHHILRGLVPEALKILDGRLRAQEKKTWAVSLLTLLLFSSCVEQSQVAVDAFLFAKLPMEGADHIYTRQHGRESCRSLEQQTLEHIQLLVEGVLKGIITKKCNPFRVGAQRDDESGMNDAEKNLVADIRQIMTDYEEDIAIRARDTYYGGLSYLTSDYKNFKERNSARLISKALRKLADM